MASLLQGLVVIMLIHLVYIMLSRQTLYARSGIYAVYLEETINELILRLIGTFRKIARQLLILLSQSFFFFKSARFLANDSSRQLIIDAYFQIDNQALSHDLFVHATLRKS